ncbi:hypothetical protein LMTR13_05760 [Bradyrhizobium icense]|uniref:Uncharacterized protein n=2 Tax=Bradyrhizobium icense TaxID=1274631 RepID=A0A1B1URL2_9BRAD|nr:hypothetical protein LMTR13_05760 [Bradyrhizobium icense]
MIAVCVSTSSAHAYLDPGTGSIILQVLLGGIAGLVLAIKLYWHKFLSLSGLSSPARKSGRSEPNAGIDERSGS